MSMVSQSHQWLLSKRQYLLVSWSSHANIKLPLRRYVWRGLRYPNYNYFSRALLWHGSLHWNFLYSIFLFKDQRSTEPWRNWRRNLTWRYCANCSMRSTWRSTPIWISFVEALNVVIGFYIAPWEHSPFCCQQMYIKLLSCAIYHAEQLRI